jgi:4-hydroxy-tetrahydrodipicolinate synthase
MMKRRFSGVFPMLPTPFDSNAKVALGDVEKLTKHVLKSGAHGIAALGLAGEARYLTEDERMSVLECVANTAGHAPVVAGISADTTAQACRLARHAALMGVALVMVAPPSAAAMTRSALTDHYLAIADAASGAGVMIQDAPGFVDVDLGAAFIRQLAAACPAISAVKVEGAPVGERIADCIEALGALKLPVFGGNGGLHAMDALDAGASAMIPGCELVAGHVRLFQAYASGDREGAAQLYKKLLPLFAFQMQNLNFYIACNKEILWRRKLIGSTHMRAPIKLGSRSKASLIHYEGLALAGVEEDSACSGASALAVG